MLAAVPTSQAQVIDAREIFDAKAKMATPETIAPPYVKSMAVDHYGNTYVVGTIEREPGHTSMAVWKYDPNGNLYAPQFPAIWPPLWGNGPAGKFYGITLGLQRLSTDEYKVFLVGTGPANRGTGNDYVIAVFDGIQGGGLPHWVASYNNDDANLDDIPVAVVVNPMEGENTFAETYVVGTSAGKGTSKDWAIVRFSGSGHITHVERLATNFEDRAVAAAGVFVAEADPDPGAGCGTLQFNRLVVTGTTADPQYGVGENYLTVCYTVLSPCEPNNFGERWRRSYDNGGNDVPAAMDVNGMTIVVTGTSDRVVAPGVLDPDILTVGYWLNNHPTSWNEGDDLWPPSRYNGTGNGPDIARAIKAEGAAEQFWDYITITGTSLSDNGTGMAIVTLAIRQEDGGLYWFREDKWPGFGSDVGTAVVNTLGFDLLNDTGAVYVAGSIDTGSSLQFRTSRLRRQLEFGQTVPEELWVKFYDSGGDDVPTGISAIRDSGVIDLSRIVVNGRIMGTRLMTLGYEQCIGPCPP